MKLDSVTEFTYFGVQLIRIIVRYFTHIKTCNRFKYCDHTNIVSENKRLRRSHLPEKGSDRRFKNTAQ